MNVADHTPGTEKAQGHDTLFFNTCLALSCGRLRLKPREKQLCLVLAVESFGRGSASGTLDLEMIWERLGPSWRRNELLQLLEEWRRAGWIGVDAVRYRLAPDRLPGWAECFLPRRAGSGTSPELALRTDDHVASCAAELSQERACASRAEPDRPPDPGGGAKISHRSNCENFAPQPLRSETFRRSDVSTVKRSENVNVGHCENFAALKERIREFVGQADWGNPLFWNSGAGWREKIFTEEGMVLEAALNYVEAGLRSGESTLRKTRGAMLWDQFQRERRKKMQT